MEKYIGTKLILAESMTKNEYYAKIKGITADEDNQPGYMVEYEDGYISWSPKNAFENAYRKSGNLTFGMAFDSINKGFFSGMRLPQWKEDVVIRIQRPDEYSKMTAPYLYVESRYGKIPWRETMVELFSEDWEVVE